MWLYVCVTIFVIYLIFKERDCLGCPSIFTGQDCNNLQGKALIGTDSSDSDTPSQILEKISFAADYQSRFVRWRSFVIAAFFGMIMLWFVVFQRIPTEWELICGMLVMFILLSFVDGFYKFHLHKHIQNNIVDSVDRLRGKKNSEGYKDISPYHDVYYSPPDTHTPFLY